MLWILLPAFNEEDSLRVLIPKIGQYLHGASIEYRIVVVNDGSVDATATVLETLVPDYPLEIVTHRINRGLGETERDGFEYIAERCGPDDIIVRLDSDDTHEPEYIGDLIETIHNGFDVVNTSRYQKGGDQIGINNYRTFISYCANLFMRCVFHVPGVRDYSCGFRAYRARAIVDSIHIYGNNFIQLKGLGFTSTLEMMVKLKIIGCRFAEVPFTLRYDQKKSVSKMVSSITIFGYLVMALLYHWPVKGWRIAYRELGPLYRQDRRKALELYSWNNRLKKNYTQKIG